MINRALVVTEFVKGRTISSTAAMFQVENADVQQYLRQAIIGLTARLATLETQAHSDVPTVTPCLISHSISPS